MRKIVTVLLSLLLITGLVACGSNGQAGNNTSETESEIVPESEETDSAGQGLSTDIGNDDADIGNAGGKTLVVYYSASGNTKEVAGYIAAETNGDLFEIVPAEIYTDADLDWTDEDSRVSIEHDNEDKREVELVSDTVENWDEYDTVFIGYPIWWGIAAWPVDGFIKANDFTGKTVIPFCTSASSGLGESGELLEEMAGTGEWLEGERFRSGASEETVQSWVAELGL